MRQALAALLLSVLAAAPAAAQAVDWCGSPLALQADPQTALLWRLRCTIQLLDRARAEEADHVTTAETDKALSEAHLKSVEEELTKTRQELEKTKKSAPPEKK
jgi:hypothetical protein